MKTIAIASLILCSLNSFASPDAEHSPRFLVHLLDYLAKDYAGAVQNGKVISQSEYNEQVEFSAAVVKTSVSLDEIKSNSTVTGQIAQLNTLILKKADPTKVSVLARAIQAKVIEITKVELAPTQWPSLKRGLNLFAQNCVSCHGATGAGDGLVGKNLDPKPANFLDSHMNEISPFQAFNTIRLGVPGTGMAPFSTLSDKEVWDLAFYVVSLRHQKLEGMSNLGASDTTASELKKFATSSDDKLREEGKSTALIASIRSHSDDDSSGGNSLDVARADLDQAVVEYKKGDHESAKANALKAYLEGIEPIEPRLKATNLEAVSILETKMAAVRSAIESHEEIGNIESAVAAAKAQIDDAEKLLKSEAMSPMLAFLAAAAILLREGFEAVLIIIALLGVIRAAGSKKAALWVHGGWVSALAVGVVAWFLSGWLMGISGAQRETLEGVTSLFAVAVLLVVGFWLHSQTEIGRWTAFIHGKVQKALDGKNLYGLASIAFIAVFREAFETVLFLRAIWLEAGEGSKFALISGVVSSLALVIFLAWSLLKYSAKIPIRKLFTASSVIMLFLAFVLTGKGLHSFQETGAISVTASQALFRFDFLGVYPTWETICSQLIVFMAAFALWHFGRRPSTVRAIKTSSQN